MPLKSLINLYYKKLTGVELHILECILSNKIDFNVVTINELANICNCSTTSIHRTVKKLGFSGFSEFKFFMKDAQNNNKNLEISDYKQLIIDNINLTLDAVNHEELDKFLKIIHESNTRYAYGTGWKQSANLQGFSNDLLMYNKSLIQIRAFTDLKSTSERMNKNDVLIISSLNGNTDGVADIIKFLNLKGVHTVSFTSFGINEIAKASELNFYFQNDNYDEHNLPWPALTQKTLLDYIVYNYMLYQKENS